MEGTNTRCDGFFATWTTQKSSRALNRPESTFFRTENRAVMGFSKKDFGEVVWSSETSRDPVFLTSDPMRR